jgi:hypothetical protein
MAAMSKAYPGDDEARLFYSWRCSASPAATEYPNYLQAADIAKRVLAHNPQHPGAAHY